MSWLSKALGTGGGNPPPAPDVNQTAQQQIGYGGQVQGMNAPPQQGIFGNTSYTYGPDGHITGVNTGFNQSGQGLYDQLYSQLGTSPGDVSKSVYGQYTANLDPQWQTNSTQLDDKLANQGIPQGSEAWNQAHDQFSREKAGAYQQANNQAQIAGGQEQSRLLGGLFGLGNAATAGYQNIPQIGTPNTGAYTYQNYSGAQDAYNQQMGGSNNMMSGLFGLGGTLGGAAIKKWG